MKNKGFIVCIRSRHPSHSTFRKEIRLPFKSMVGFGSETKTPEGYIRLNSPDAVRNSSSKLRMKICFTNEGVKTPIWCQNKNLNDFIKSEKLKFPIVSKSHFGSRGRGNVLHRTKAELDKWLKDKNTEGYIFEQYMPYSREYRLHVNSEGCFYTCRKMVKKDTPDDKRWYRNDSNCVWILEENPLFDKPNNWKQIEKECVKALKSVGLDFGACDIRVQSAQKNKENPEFVIIEINSAPSMGEVTFEKYIKEIPIMLTRKKLEK